MLPNTFYTEQQPMEKRYSTSPSLA